MSSSVPSHMESIPSEIIDHIASFLPKDALLQLRLVSRRAESVATPGAFRAIELKAVGKSGDHFLNITTSDKLRHYVKEVTCDTMLPDFEFTFRHENNPTIDYTLYSTPRGFLHALIGLRFLSHLDTLKIVFPVRVNWTDNQDAPTRALILVTLFESMSSDKPSYWLDNVSKIIGRDACESFLEEHKSKTNKDPKCPTNLYLNQIGCSSDVNFDRFQNIIKSGHLGYLNIRITRNVSIIGPSKVLPVSNPQWIEFFTRLPWLSPPAVENLQELRLLAEDWWGWAPHAAIFNEENIAALQNLKSLTLYRYVFSFQSQVDQLGALKLDKLIINGCGVMFRSLHGSSLGRGVILESDSRGNDTVSIHAAPTPDWWRSERERGAVTLSLRWHMVLDQWRESMTTLRYFEMEWKPYTEPVYVANISDTDFLPFNARVLNATAEDIRATERMHEAIKIRNAKEQELDNKSGRDFEQGRN